MLLLKPYHKCFVCVIATTIFSVVGFLGYQSVLAQSSDTAATTGAVSIPKAQIVATTEIYSASIVSQEDSQFNLSFDFFNKEGVQPGIKYAVQLLKIDSDGGQTLVDEFVYPEVLDLKEGETKKMAISYTAPAYLQGEFSLWLAAKNSSGLPLAFSSLGKVVLSGSGQFVEIIPETCFLTIEGGAGDKKYTALQGVSVKPEENLIASCQAINHLKQDIKTTAQFQTFLGTSFGEEVVAEPQAQNAVFELKAKQQANISFYLPKSNAPQIYETKVWLASDNKPISNKATFHYIVAGQSATIQNIIFDKDFYKKGETANIQLLWSIAGSQPAGQFSFIIKDKQDKLCSDIVNQSLDEQASFLTLASPIIKDCEGPKIEATIKDRGGNVLDSKTFSVDTGQATATLSAGLWRRYEKIILAAVIVLVLLLAFITIIRKKKLGKSVSLFLIVGFFIFFNFLFFSEAFAATVEYGICRAGEPFPCSGVDLLLTVRFVDSLDKDAYSPREMATVTEGIQVLYLSNEVSAGDFTSSVSIAGFPLIFDHRDIYVALGGGANNSVTASIGSNVGSFTATFTHTATLCSADHSCITMTDSYLQIPYTVICVPLGSSGCSVPSDCCGSSSCTGGKCCLSENTACFNPGQPDNQCCSGQCNSQSKCGPQTCFEDGLTCSNPSQCCSGYCNSQNKCGPSTCTANGLNCPSAPGQCCSGICSAGECGAPSCTANGDDCWDPSDCCSGQCNSDGICWTGCKNNDAVCNYNWQCCSGYCTVADGNYGTKRCKNHDFYPCPNKGSYCPYSSPAGQRIYNSEGALCPSGTLNTCPNPSTYCPNAVLFNSCGTRCPQGTKNISQPAYCNPSLGFISVQSNTGKMKLNLISVADYGSNFLGMMKVFWKGGQPTAAADLVPLTDPEASPVRVKTSYDIKAWRRWWPNTPAPSVCLLQGAVCNYQDDCCSKICSGGLCVCKSNSTACVKDTECCTGYCPEASNTCACIPMGSSILCQQNSQCCSGGCKGTVGSPGICCYPAGALPSYCSYGNNPSCCSGHCSDSTGRCL